MDGGVQEGEDESGIKEMEQRFGDEKGVAEGMRDETHLLEGELRQPVKAKCWTYARHGSCQ